MGEKTIHIIEHLELRSEDAGRAMLRDMGFDLVVHEPFKVGKLPVLTGEEAGLMIMGGPQMISEHEKWPYLAEEFNLIESAMELGVPLMGICLGSQMIAHILGAKVGYAGPDELSMGFYETAATADGKAWLPEKLMTLNGNAQGWDLPAGATLLATSAGTVHPNQAFSYGENVMALQFHPEVTRDILSQWQDEFGHMIGRRGTQSLDQQNSGFLAHDTTLKAWYRDMLSGFFS